MRKFFRVPAADAEFPQAASEPAVIAIVAISQAFRARLHSVRFPILALRIVVTCSIRPNTMEKSTQSLTCDGPFRAKDVDGP